MKCWLYPSTADGMWDSWKGKKTVTWEFGGGTFPQMRRLFIWANYNDLTTTSPEMMVSKGNHPLMALIQVSEILWFTKIYSICFQMWPQSRWSGNRCVFLWEWKEFGIRVALDTIGICRKYLFSHITGTSPVGLVIRDWGIMRFRGIDMVDSYL